MDTRPIGVFDSGVGGLSILQEVKKILPSENYIFLADQANVPYGGKTAEELKQLTSKITDFFIASDVKLIVVACNTATCYAVNHLRERYPLFFIGTVPAIKPAAELSKNKIIGVLSTPATSKSPYLKNLIAEFAQDVEVVNIGCPGLEEAVEHGDINSEKVSILLSKYLTEIESRNSDYVVLGCTHYPFLKHLFSKLTKNKITPVDSGEAVARHTKQILVEHGQLNNSGQGSVSYLTTGNPILFSRAASQLLNTLVSAKKVFLD